MSSPWEIIESRWDELARNVSKDASKAIFQLENPPSGLLWNETDSVSGQLPNYIVDRDPDSLNTPCHPHNEAQSERNRKSKSAEVEGVEKSKFEFNKPIVRYMIIELIDIQYIYIYAINWIDHRTHKLTHLYTTDTHTLHTYTIIWNVQ